MMTKPSWRRTGNIISWIAEGHGEPVTTMIDQVASSVAAIDASTTTATVGRIQRRSERAMTTDALAPSTAIPT